MNEPEAHTISENIIQRPQIFFFTEPGESADQLALLHQPNILQTLRSCAAGVAVAISELDQQHSAIVRLLMAHAIPIVAWIVPPSSSGGVLSLTNYPQAAAYYRELRAWIAEEQLSFNAIGLAIEPPSDDNDPSDWSLWRATRSFARGLWLARDNALYPPSKAAYRDLIATMRHDGYEVHAYQLPFVADDRRAGTTLMQRALDIIDLPSDVDVLLCGSDVPIDWLDGDLGGALIASYGPGADALGVDVATELVATESDTAWHRLRRDLLLAAQHTDTLYINSLEQCIRAGLLERIALLDWRAPAKVRVGRRWVVRIGRTSIWALLMLGRYGWRSLAWTGWLFAFFLWLRRRR